MGVTTLGVQPFQQSLQTQSVLGLTGTVLGPQGNPPPPVDQRFASDLATLITNAGTTPFALATAIGVDPIFLARVIGRRQPLPSDVARLIAAELELDFGTVFGAAGLVTRREGPIYRVPVPPDPLLGDVVSGVALGVTQPVNAPARSVVGAWIVGFGIGGTGATGVAIVDRTLGVVARAPLVNESAAIDLAFGPGGAVWTVGIDGYAAQVDLFPKPAMRLEAIVPSNSGGRIVYEARSNAIWVGVVDGLLWINSIDPVVSDVLAPIVLGQHGSAAGVIQVGSKLYAVALCGAGKNALVEIDPVAKTQLRTSSSSSAMLAPVDVAFDGTYFLVTDGQFLYSVDLATFTAHAVANDAAPNDANYVTYALGSFWVSDTDEAGFPRIFRLKLTSATTADVVADYSIGAHTQHPTVGCRVVVDGDGFVWAVNPSDGTVLILDPTQTSGDPTIISFDSGGTATGIAIL